MPHIKTIRLTNVHFNNATQFYEDFSMDWGGKNTTYNLANGGGKSVLLLLLLQTVLPKSYLRKDKPLSLLFQGGRDRTSHVAVEWMLEEDGGYRYLLTGFSARKKKGAALPAPVDGGEEEENLMASDIEHLSWCVFYNDSKITDIKTAPLARQMGNKKVYAGFDDIRRYIQQMRQKGLPAEIFDGIDKYQSFIASHHLLAAEWNIIRGINSGENNIESYFRRHTTSRKLIENQFIKIIEDVETLHRGGNYKDDSLLLADTLIEIRTQLQDYLRLKGHLAEYGLIMGYFKEFGAINDDFLRVFRENDAAKASAAGILNLIIRQLAELDEKEQETEGKLQYSKQGHREGLQLKKILEAGLVDHERKGFVAIQEQLEANQKELAEKQLLLTEHLHHLMVLEGYGEYRKISEKIIETRQQLENLARDGDSLQNDYLQMGGKLKYHTTRQHQELQELLAELNHDKTAHANARDRFAAELNRHTATAATFKEKIRTLTEREKKYEKEIGELNDFFVREGEMKAVILPDEYRISLENEILRNSQEKDSVLREKEDAVSQQQKLDLEEAGLKSERDAKEGSKKDLERWHDNYRSRLEELRARARSFGHDTLDDYKSDLKIQIGKESLQKLEREIELGRMRQKKQLSEDRGYYVPNEEILALASLLEAKCEFVQAGIDWLDRAQPGLKEELLRVMPYLPFAVIVDRPSFERLQRGSIKIDFPSDYPVPVVNLEAIRQLGDAPGQDTLYFCSFAGLLLDPAQYEDYIRNTQSRITAAEGEILAAEGRIAQFSEDLSHMEAFRGRYPQNEVAEKTDALTRVSDDILALTDRLKELNEAKRALANREFNLETRRKELEQLIATGNDKLAKITRIAAMEEDLAAIKEDLGETREELQAAETDIATAKDNEIKEHDLYNTVMKELEGLKFRLHDLAKDTEKLAGFTEIKNEEDMGKISATFTALQSAVSGSMAEETVLRNNLGENESQLGRLRNRILRDHDEDLEDLARTESVGTPIIIPAPDMIKDAQAAQKQNGVQLEQSEKKVTTNSLLIEKAEGKLEVLLEDIEDITRDALPVYENEQAYQKEINQARLLIDSYAEEITSGERTLGEIKERRIILVNQKDDFEGFLEREKVSNSGAIADETIEFRQFEREFRRLQGDLDRLSVRWEDRVKTVQAETVDFLIREPLEELGKINHPTGTAQCLARVESFSEYIATIEEQRQKVSDDILQLESYQEDFARRCLQRAELVLGHLKKIEALSRIEVHGRRTSMVELKLHEFEKEDKHRRMKAHIDGIVKEIENEGIVDRKRVATRLSTKELIAQIVDMDRAAVRLFKVESIPENSRFYRWEYAVGSEGQNNSLYFIFAACLISFIRMLSITNNTVKTKKVIIADNPFGSTSAVYLWEPMFKILAQNDFQLIAPGHDIPREITSSFSVSYLLNQDILQDGRLKVVVKDVRAEEDEEVLRYMDLEQMTLF